MPPERPPSQSYIRMHLHARIEDWLTEMKEAKVVFRTIREAEEAFQRYLEVDPNV
jgi:hypothetical protein